MNRHLAAGIVAVAALVCAGRAAAQVDVLGGGLAEACATAAKAGDSTGRAEQVCTQALERELLVPRDRAGTYVNRGIIKLRGQHYDAAMTDFDTAIKYQSNLAEAYVNRGAARIGAHRFGESISDFNTALDLGVKEPEKTYYNRALAHEWMDDYKAAWLDYSKALELAPDWDLVKQQLARFTVSHAGVGGADAPAKP
jgi:tetratricopeptide (TPR) repeat protein